MPRHFQERQLIVACTGWWNCLSTDFYLDWTSQGSKAFKIIIDKF